MEIHQHRDQTLIQSGKLGQVTIFHSKNDPPRINWVADATEDTDEIRLLALALFKAADMADEMRTKGREQERKKESRKERALEKQSSGRLR
jgi:hypothetical protein